MKKFFVLCFLSMLMSCHKDVTDDPLIFKIREQLASQMETSALDRLDWDRTVVSREGPITFMRIGITGMEIATDFVLLRLDGPRVVDGRIISIHPVLSIGLVSGTVSIHRLDGSVIVDNASIAQGYIQWGRGDIGLREMLVPAADGKVLPEVILVATYKKPNPTTSYYYSLAGLMGGGSAGNSAFYSSSSGSGGGSGSTSGGSSTGKLPAGKSDSKIDNAKGGSGADVILVDFERAQENPAINLDQYIKCFSAVPDNGASCSITIFTDIPVDGRPEQFFDWKNGSPGHSFLQLQKTNGSNSVIQIFGFYPQSGWKTFTTPAPVSGKFADNGGHEFNVSLKMNLSAAQLQSVLNEIARHKSVQYDIDDYNCTDFALEIFNYQRTNKLVIPKYDLPGGQAPYGSNTPQGLYVQLKGMKSGGGADAANINVPGVKGYVAYGKGPCN